MDLTRTSSQELGSVLSRIGVTWAFDDDGDIRLRFRSGEQPWTDVVFYEFDTAKADFSMRGQFLNGHAVPQGNGMTQWEVPLDSGHKPTAVAQKVVTAYLTPRPGGVRLQIHASVAPLNQPRPMHIKIIPNSRQVSTIERRYPGFAGLGDGRQYWIHGEAVGTRVDDSDLLELVRKTFQVGLDMFDEPFTGWMHSTDA